MLIYKSAISACEKDMLVDWLHSSCREAGSSVTDVPQPKQSTESNSDCFGRLGGVLAVSRSLPL